MELKQETTQRGVVEFIFVAGPKIMGGLCTLIFNLIALRYLGPEQFGVLAVCVMAIILSDAILGAAIDMAILRLAPLYQISNPEYSLQVQQAGLLLKPLGAAVCGIVVFLFSRPICHVLFQREGEEKLLYLTLLAVLGLLLLRSAQMQFQVNRRFIGYGSADLLHHLVKFGGISAQLFWGWVSPAAILSYYAIGPCAVAIVVLCTFGQRLLTVQVSLQAVSELLGVTKWYLLTIGLSTIVSRMDIFLVSAYASVREAGIFSAGQVVALVPQLIGTYLAVVFSPRVMPLWRAGSLFSFYRRFQFSIAVVCIAIYLAAWMGIHTLGGILFPASFSRSSLVILVLLPGALAALANFPLTVSFLLFAKPKFIFLLECITLPLMLGIYTQVIPRYGAVGAAAVTTSFALLKIACMQVAAWKWTQSDFVASEREILQLGAVVPEGAGKIS